MTLESLITTVRISCIRCCLKVLAQENTKNEQLEASNSNLQLFSEPINNSVEQCSRWLLGAHHHKMDTEIIVKQKTFRQRTDTHNTPQKTTLWQWESKSNLLPIQQQHAVLYM